MQAAFASTSSWTEVGRFQGKKFLNVRCKGQKIRTVLLTKEAADTVRNCVEHHRVAGSTFLFSNRYGGSLSRNGVANAFNKIAACNANLFGDEKIELRPHLLRHRHCYQARAKGGDVFAAKRLGHSSLKHLERYSMLTDAEETAILEQM